MSKICKYCIHENTKTCKQCQRNGYGNEDRFSEKCCGKCKNYYDAGGYGYVCKRYHVCKEENGYCDGGKPKEKEDE